MLESLNPLILDSIKDGKVIYDKGLWKRLEAKFDELLKSGTITPKEEGWITSTTREKCKLDYCPRHSRHF